MKEKLKIVFEKINFVCRYQKICEEHSDFDNRMSKNNKKLTDETLDFFKYNYKYFTNGSFYQIKEVKDDITFQLHLVLKGGVVESLLYIYIKDKFMEPNGRFDFLPEKLGIPFERDKYNLFFYVNEDELRLILKEIFSIYEDLKDEFIKQYS